MYDVSFLQRARALCDQYGVLLIFDEVATGFGRTGNRFVADLVQPDILILDEVLSVGDGAFKKKSEKKMREIIAGGATTILVSHSLEQIRQLCTKVLWLEKGRQIAFGETQPLCGLYQDYLDKKLPLDRAKALAAQSRI